KPIKHQRSPDFAETKKRYVFSFSLRQKLTRIAQPNRAAQSSPKQRAEIISTPRLFSSFLSKLSLSLLILIHPFSRRIRFQKIYLT
ncbi:MAG: hypothetical protein LBT62_05195, partial [Deltaproteobacteria bacterium]|nr:hypothetical protein [Deltaproteobacteria bacterium]